MMALSEKFSMFYNNPDHCAMNPDNDEITPFRHFIY
mgnify:CR=1 FL=1